MTIMRLSLSAAALLAGLGVACAQQAPANNDQAKSMQGGKEEPGSHASTGSEPVFVDGKLAVPGAPADSQTVPSKVSERNARLDAMPIMALPTGITDDQKKQIAEVIAKSQMPVSQISAKLADLLPATTPVSDMPADLKSAVPMARDFSVIRTKDKILLVRAPNMVVTGEIAVQ